MYANGQEIAIGTLNYVQKYPFMCRDGPVVLKREDGGPQLVTELSRSSRTARPPDDAAPGGGHFVLAPRASVSSITIQRQSSFLLIIPDGAAAPVPS
jgi:hypothetical protein